jgi:hypothetical protein
MFHRWSRPGRASSGSGTQVTEPTDAPTGTPSQKSASVRLGTAFTAAVTVSLTRKGMKLKFSRPSVPSAS